MKISLQKFEHTRGGTTGKKFYDFIVFVDGVQRATWQHEYRGKGYYLSVRHGEYYDTIKRLSTKSGVFQRRLVVKADKQADLEEQTRRALDEGLIPTIPQLVELARKHKEEKQRQADDQKVRDRANRIESRAAELYTVLFDIIHKGPNVTNCDQAKELIKYVEQN